MTDLIKQFYLPCGHCGDDVFLRDTNWFEGGEEDFCANCGSRNIVQTDAEQQPWAEEVESGYEAIVRLQGEIDSVRGHVPPGPGWTAELTWEDDGSGDVRAVWTIAGPEPFGGLRCRSQTQAEAVCEALNGMTGREPEQPAVESPEPHPIVEQLGELAREQLSDQASVQVDGLRITITAGDDAVAEQRKLSYVRVLAMRWAAERSWYGVVLLARNDVEHDEFSRLASQGMVDHEGGARWRVRASELDAEERDHLLEWVRQRMEWRRAVCWWCHGEGVEGEPPCGTDPGWVDECGECEGAGRLPPDRRRRVGAVDLAFTVACDLWPETMGDDDVATHELAYELCEAAGWPT